MKWYFLRVLFFCLSPFLVAEQKVPDKYSLKSELLFQHPSKQVLWGFDWSRKNKDFLILTLRNGEINAYNLISKELRKLASVDGVLAGGQGGLLDIRVLEKGDQEWIYFSYTYKAKEGKGSHVRLSRAQIDWKKYQLKDFQVLFTTVPDKPKAMHFGSRIEFDEKKEKVFLSVGERGERQNAQDPSVQYGMVARFNLDGSIPEDNPFFNSQEKNAHVIWTMGHRNPQGLARVPGTDYLLEQEHGPKGGDEINLILKGHNYGWPIVTYGHEYSGPKIGVQHRMGLDQPLYHFTPSIAPSGLMVYSGKKYPALKDHIFSGSLKLKHLNHLVPQKKLSTLLVFSDKREIFEFNEYRHFKDLNQRIRNVRESPEGEIFVSTDDGQLYRVYM